MSYFQPKHSKYAYDNEKSYGIFINLMGNILITNKLYEDLIEIKYKDYMHVHINMSKFSIMYDGNKISYGELSLVDNAVSVCYTQGIFIILLSNGKLIYVFAEISMHYLNVLHTIVSKINIQYITVTELSMHSTTPLNPAILIYSNNILYSIGVKLNIDLTINIEKYEKVIGYFVSKQVVFILYEELRFECITNKPLYILNLDSYPTSLNNIALDKDFTGLSIEIDPTNLLPKEDIELIACISAQIDYIHIILDDKILYYTFEKVIEWACDPIYKVLNAKWLKFIHFYNLCLLKDNTLLIKNSMNNKLFETKLNVERCVCVESIAVCIQLDGTVSILEPKDSQVDHSDIILYNFCRYSGSIFYNIKKVIKYNKDDGNHFLIYLSMENTIEIFNIESLEFENLDIFLRVPTGTFKLELINYMQGSYI